MGLRHFFLVIFLVFGFNAFAQEPVFISYELMLRNGLARDVLESKYRNYTHSHDSLSQDQFLEIKDMFVNHIYQSDSVLSYVRSMGMIRPTKRPFKTITFNTDFLNKDSICCNGEFIFNSNNAERFTSLEEDILLKRFDDEKEKVTFKGGRFRTVVDTVLVENIYGPSREYLVESNWDLDTMISALSFLESWRIDSSEYKFIKEIEHLGCLENKQSDESGAYIGLRPLFNFELLSGRDNSISLFAENTSYDVAFHSNCVDGYSTDNYLSPKYRKYFLEVLFSTIQSNQFKIVEYNQHQELNFGSDSVDIESFFENFTYYTEGLFSSQDSVAHLYDLSSIAGMRFVEDWFISPDGFYFEKKVKALILLKKGEPSKNAIPENLTPIVPFAILFDG